MKLSLILLLVSICLQQSTCDPSCSNHDVESGYNQRPAPPLDLQELRELIAAAEKTSSDLQDGLKRARQQLGAASLTQSGQQDTTLALGGQGKLDLSSTGAVDFQPSAGGHPPLYHHQGAKFFVPMGGGGHIYQEFMGACGGGTR